MDSPSRATSGASSDDNVGTVDIPVTLSLPAGYASWPSTEIVHYGVDASSTAEYGVDYKMAGGTFTFDGGAVPTTQSIRLQILHDGVPKTRTVVIRLGAANTVTALGPIATFTYTIHN